MRMFYLIRIAFPLIKMIECLIQVITNAGPEYYDTEMDKEFLLELRELKVLMDREKEHKQ